ncbi:MAG: formyltransferase family protein [Candidatus Nanopelagicales bacterium]|nr:formyltransferase family protein [Candidatus Nanopelagicales bacterium]
MSKLSNTRFVLLGARSLRLSAYSSVLLGLGVRPASIILYNESKQHIPRDYPSASDSSWSPLPDWLQKDWGKDFDSLLSQTKESHFFPESLGSSELIQTLQGTIPDYVIYAGAAGNIVPKEILDIAPVIHIHPGALPMFRGSTTIYWALLQEMRPTCTAMFLNEYIDQGLIIHEKVCSMPTRLSELDSFYDAGVRAETLKEVLVMLAKDELRSKEQNSQGKDYYVIHPVLKNLVLSLLREGSLNIKDH